MLRLVIRRMHSVATARISLRTSRGGVDWHIRRVPKDLSNDPGFVYKRVRWRRRKGRDDAAYDLLKKVPPDAPEAKRWWVERSILARRLLAKGHISDAYRIACPWPARWRAVRGGRVAKRMDSASVSQ